MLAKDPNESLTDTEKADIDLSIEEYRQMPKQQRLSYLLSFIEDPGVTVIDTAHKIFKVPNLRQYKKNAYDSVARDFSDLYAKKLILDHPNNRPRSSNKLYIPNPNLSKDDSMEIGQGC